MNFALCNELFQGVPFPQACQTIHSLGYTGLEIAPFTLASDPAALSSNERRAFQSAMAGHGLSFVGLHWLLAAPAGLHITTNEESVRRRSWDYVRRFVDLCVDLAGNTSGHNGILVFGSPRQRSTTNGMSRAEAMHVFTRELAHVAGYAEERGVRLLVEALPANQSDVINSLAEAAAIVEEIASPAVQTMFDVHNAIDEPSPHADLLKRYFTHIRHVHVNELDGREPGIGDYDFAKLLSTLTALNYPGWVSLEAFDFSRDPREIAARAISHLRAALPSAALAETI